MHREDLKGFNRTRVKHKDDDMQNMQNAFRYVHVYLIIVCIPRRAFYIVL